jgi:hypothetical protein
LSVNFSIQNALKQGDALSLWLFNLASEYVIRKVQENHMRLKLNVPHQLLIYAADVNLLGYNIDTVKKNTETQIEASQEEDLEVNAEKTKYILLSRYQNAGKNHDIKIANRSFENMAQIKHLGTTVTNQNLINKEIKRRQIQIMLTTIQPKTFCFLVCCLKT